MKGSVWSFSIVLALVFCVVGASQGDAADPTPTWSIVTPTIVGPQDRSQPGTAFDQEPSATRINLSLVVVLGILVLLVIAATVGAIVWVLRRPLPQEPLAIDPPTPVPVPEPSSLPEPKSAVQLPPRPAEQPIRGPYLECHQQSGSPLRLELRAPLQTIGRALDNDLVIDDRFPNYESVSRYHATVRSEHGMWIIYDEGKTGQPSTNGVFVEKRQTKKNVLRSGWLVEIGSVQFVFIEPGGAS